MSPWANLFWLIVITLFLLGLHRWIVTHIHGIGLLLSQSRASAIWLYFILFLPGVFIHELSHYLMALALGVKTGQFSLWPQSRGRQVVLGSVAIRGAGPVRHSLIGAAPIISGTFIVITLGHWLGLQNLTLALFSGDFAIFFTALRQSLITPDFWLWFYLLFVVANTMLPSPSDRLYWTPILLFLGTVLILVIGLDVLAYFPSLSELIQNTIPGVLSVLISALLAALIVNFFFIVFIIILESLLEFITGRKIEY